MVDMARRFCMITTFYPPYNFGGDGISVRRLANALARQGHHVEVIHCIDAYRVLAGSEPPGVYDDHPNVIVHGLRSRFGSLSPLLTQQTGIPFFKAKRIAQILEKGFDVIHFHNISLVGGPGILKYGRAVKLYSIRDYWMICPTHILFRYNATACTRRDCFLCTLALECLDHDKLWSFYRNAVAVVVPSLCYDIFPLVVIEAFTQATSAIVRDLGGMPEFIEESGGGYAYRTDAELSAAMNRLLQDTQHRNVLGQRGYRAYREKWSEEVHVERYLALIDRIAGEKRHKGSTAPDGEPEAVKKNLLSPRQRSRFTDPDLADLRRPAEWFLTMGDGDLEMSWS